MEDPQEVPAAEPYQALIHCVPSKRGSNSIQYWYAIVEGPGVQRPIMFEMNSESAARDMVSRAIYGQETTIYGSRALGRAHVYETRGEELPCRKHQKLRYEMINKGHYQGAEGFLEKLRAALVPTPAANRD